MSSALLAGKVAIVTGGGAGIGRCTSQRLATAGAKVVVTDIDDAGGEDTVGRITAAGGGAMFLHQDVTTKTGGHTSSPTPKNASGG